MPNIPQLIAQAKGGILPNNGIYSGYSGDADHLAPNTDFINITRPPQNCHCFLGAERLVNTQICIIPTNLANSIVTTNGMNGCSIYIYKLNNHFVFFHNWCDTMLLDSRNITFLRDMINAKAETDRIPNWVNWTGPLTPVYTIKWGTYSAQMQSRTENHHPFCFVPILFPISDTLIRAWFLFFERNIEITTTSRTDVPWTYDRRQSNLMDLFIPHS